MAYKKKTTAGTFTYTIRRKNLLPKPLYFTFEDEREGDMYVNKLEKLLDAGIVPEGFIQTKDLNVQTIETVIRKYFNTVAVPDSDTKILNFLIKMVGHIKIQDLNYEWVENWIESMKVQKRKPTTIRHNVGALARCLDWFLRRNVTGLVSNPLRMLPKRYASYRDVTDAIKDVSRDRRVSSQEEVLVLEIINGKIVGNRQRSIKADNKDALKLIFNLALETGMRLRELFTLETKQIDIAKSTIFLDKTKNGDKRQVPLSSVAIKLLIEYEAMHKSNSDNNMLFPYLQYKSAGWTKNELKKITDLLSSQYKRIFKYGGFGDLNFHDTRHEATCRF